jgi:hypothetical protein
VRTSRRSFLILRLLGCAAGSLRRSKRKIRGV